MIKRYKHNWHAIPGQPLTEMDKIIMMWQNKGKLVPSRQLIKTPQQIEGIRKAGLLNTAVLDEVAKNISAGMSTEDINTIVHEFTIAHGGIPAPLNYEGFPKSVCTSVNEVVCHGIPNEYEILEEGDIVNVDCTTILDGFYADASRMFVIGKTTQIKQKLVDVAKECLEIGINTVKPYCFVGDIGYEIAKHAHKNGFSVVRDLCGHGVGNAFHEEPDIDHYGKRGHGMLLVPGMVFTIEPMVNMGDWRVFVDEEDGWTVVSEDELPSAQWEHTLLLKEDGVEILTW